MFVVGMFTGVFITLYVIRQRSQQLEMRHRERMAMIERGQIPLDPPHGRWAWRRQHCLYAPDYAWYRLLLRSASA